MSAILSADDLNDFISPGVACIKPVETLPQKGQSHPEVCFFSSINSPTSNDKILICNLTYQDPYQVTTEDKVQHENPPPAQISLTDCLACSGCVTSAEAVLISLQSHSEVLNTLDAYPGISLTRDSNGIVVGSENPSGEGKIFVASVSPQVRASLAATYGITEQEASHMIDQFLRGPHGLRNGGAHGNCFTWVVDTNIMREVVLTLTADEVMEMKHLREPSAASDSSSPIPQRPVLSSACPGWICYAEKSKPFTIPHLSRLKSPQALTGTFLKTTLSKVLGVPPSQIWHLAIMPCFDKKLEASREELTDVSWQPLENRKSSTPIRDVDCVITSRELLTLASSRGIYLQDLPLRALSPSYAPHIPDQILDSFFFSNHYPPRQTAESGTSGGYLYHVLAALHSRNPGSKILIKPGRHDVVEYELLPSKTSTGKDEMPKPIFTAARYYGFKNIQNLVRKLEPKRMPGLLGKKLPATGSRRQPISLTSSKGADYDYVEVMACPGGCTNGGGQIRFEDTLKGASQDGSDTAYKPSSEEKRAWLKTVDEAYFSAESDSDTDGEHQSVESSLTEAEEKIREIMQYWSRLMDVPLPKLVYTTYRKVESDVGKTNKFNDTARVVELAGRIGGGW